jgi:hypothetical protein
MDTWFVQTSNQTTSMHLVPVHVCICLGACLSHVFVENVVRNLRAI